MNLLLPVGRGTYDTNEASTHLTANAIPIISIEYLQRYLFTDSPSNTMETILYDPNRDKAVAGGATRCNNKYRWVCFLTVGASLVAVGGMFVGLAAPFFTELVTSSANAFSGSDPSAEDEDCGKAPLTLRRRRVLRGERPNDDITVDVLKVRFHLY